MPDAAVAAVAAAPVVAPAAPETPATPPAAKAPAAPKAAKKEQRFSLSGAPIVSKESADEPVAEKETFAEEDATPGHAPGGGEADEGDEAPGGYQEAP